MSRFLMCKPPLGAVSYDATGTTKITTGSSFTFPITVGTGNGIVVCVCSGLYTTSSVSIPSYSFTYLGGTSVNYFGSNYYVTLWGLYGAGVTSGAKTISVSMGGSSYIAAGAVSYNNVTGFGTAVTYSSPGSGVAHAITGSGTTADQLFALGAISPNTSGSFTNIAAPGTRRWTQAYSGGVNYPSAFYDQIGPNPSMNITSPGSYWCEAGVPIL